MTAGRSDNGVSVPKWNGRRMMQAIAAVRARGSRDNLPCFICQQAIDYSLPGTEALGMSVEHIKPRSTHPQLTWDPANWAPAHLYCNQQKGNRPKPTLGALSESW